MLLTPEIYEILAHTKPGAGGEIQLTDAMAEYARTRGGMTAVEFTGKHYDMGNKLKVVEAQVELALQHLCNWKKHSFRFIPVVRIL